MTKTEWIEKHLEELQEVQTLPPITGALAYSELVEEFYTLFKESLTENIKEYIGGTNV